MVSRGFQSPCTALAVAVVVAACSARSVDVSSAPPPPTTADFYGTYEIILAGGEPATPGNEMIATWDESGLTVEQMGNQILHTQMELSTNPGELAIWSEDDSDPLCRAEGLYSYVDDGSTITITLISDGCEGRSHSADGGRLVRLN
ncbi:MAG: hypothetical protein ACE5FP_08260 [Gemmatimonadota bacterium]